MVASNRRRLRSAVATFGKVIEVIDINTASAAEIDAVEPLKGHGFEIVRYRDERGRFDALRNLEEVPGLAGKVARLDGVIGFG